MCCRFESQHLLHALGEGGVKNWLALSEGAGGSLGLLTTAGRKEEYCLLLREALRVGRIALHKDFFSNSLGTAEAKTRLKEELLNFSVVTEPPKTLFGKVRKTFTGKLGGKQDDLVRESAGTGTVFSSTQVSYQRLTLVCLHGMPVAMQMAIYSSKVFHQVRAWHRIPVRAKLCVSIARALRAGAQVRQLAAAQVGGSGPTRRALRPLRARTVATPPSEPCACASWTLPVAPWSSASRRS